MTDADKFFKSTKNQLIGLEVLVGAHLLATLVFGGLAASKDPNKLVNGLWAIVSIIDIVISIALAVNIFKESIKDSSDKQLKDTFGAVIGLLVIHGVVSILSLLAVVLGKSPPPIIYILSGVVIVVIGILLVVLNAHNDITSLLS